MELINLTINKSIDYGTQQFNPKTMPLRGNMVEELQQAHAAGSLEALSSLLSWTEKEKDLSVDDIKALLHLEIMALNNAKVGTFNSGEIIEGVEHWTNSYLGEAGNLMQ